MVMKRENTEVRQQQIVEAAQKLIFRYGSEHLTVKRIAKEVGISEAAIYRHFTSKKSILCFLLSHIENVLIADVSWKGDGNKVVTIETIEMSIRKHFSSIDLRKGIAFQVIAEIISLGDKNLNKKTAVTINKYIAGLKGLLSEGVQSGAVRKDIDLEATAMLLFSMIQSLVNIWALNSCNFQLIEKYTSLWRVFREAIIPR
ncbi:MAG: Fatty acid metabolism regulator protein [Smithella sp. PtaU1.Bin162]|nr:MAG: Fatty acid metabolism regulator protein [Smithella sp. PtaU1.Bin162]